MEEGERLVQYVCLMPKNARWNTEAMKKKRQLYYETRRTTSHWPKLHVNPLQPRTYGKDVQPIDYSSLPPPDLSMFEEGIAKLLS